MPTPTQCTFDITPPRRPGLDDVGGGAKLDDQAFPPDPVTMLTSADLNQAENLLVRYGAVIAHTKVTVHLDGGGNPVIAQVTSCIVGVTPSTFTRTLNGAGDVSWTWSANTFPTPVADHVASCIGATLGVATAETITNGVRVRSVNGVPASAYMPHVFELN